MYEKKNKLTAFLVFTALVFGCSLSSGNGSPTPNRETQAALAVEATLTSNAGGQSSSQQLNTDTPGGGQNPPSQQDTYTPPPTYTPLPTFTSVNTQVPSATTVCDKIGSVVDVNVPDETPADPGQTFPKTWRLENAGSCTWTSGYDLVFHSGDSMGAPAAVQLTGGSVAPGGTVEITVNLTAPMSPGMHTGYFKLRNDSGNKFGWGGDANQAFWVKIKVKSPTDTPVPVVNVDFTTGYAGGWFCAYARRSLKIKNTGSVDIESMKIRLEGPIGTYLNGFSNNTPFRPVPPEPSPQCQQSGASKLSPGNTAWVGVHTNSPPPGGTSGRIIVTFCSEDGLGGACKEVTIDFTW